MSPVKIADKWAYARPTGVSENIWFAVDGGDQKRAERWRIHLGALKIDLYEEGGVEKIWVMNASPFARGLPIGKRLSRNAAQFAALATIQSLLQEHVALMDGNF